MSTAPSVRLVALAALAPVLALAYAACLGDSTGATADPVARDPLTSLGAADDPPRFSAWSTPVNLGPPVNTSFIEQGGSISKDGLSLYFHSDRAGGFGGTDIWVGRRACSDASDPACAWQTPANAGSNVNTSANETAPRLTIDGHRLYFTSNRPGGFGRNDLYVSRRRDKRDDTAWQAAVNLGSGVNTAANEAQPDPVEDDATGTTTLFFSSDRPGGPGLDDIYASTLQPDETFRPAALVAELSTPFNDRQPAIRRDGLELFLGSDRPGTLGMIDLWVATRASTADPWSTPVNLGPAINTTSLDARPALSFDGRTLYFQSTRPGGFGGFDIYRSTRTRVKGPD